MPPKRKYNIKGTKDFLILGIVLTVLCIWAVADGWYPTNKVLKKHPRQLPIRFQSDGLVTEVNVEEGDPVHTGMVLVSQAQKTARKALEDAEEAYKTARESGTETKLAAAAAEIKKLRREVEKYDLKAEKRYTIKMADGEWVVEPADPDDRSAYELKSAIVEQLATRANRYVKKGDLALVLHPKDSFYNFNKSLALFSGLGALLFFFLHWRVNRT